MDNNGDKEGKERDGNKGKKVIDEEGEEERLSKSNVWVLLKEEKEGRKMGGMKEILVIVYQKKTQ